MEKREEWAARLAGEAEAILVQTGLRVLLEGRFGRVALTGSARYGLMVWRDIDIHMPVVPEARLDYAALLPEIGRRFEAAGCRIHKAQFLDDYVEPHPLGAGLYWGIEFRDAANQPWKGDLWGWAPDDFERRQRSDRELIVRLAEADRDLILRLKTEARARPGFYGVVVSSMDVYRFAIAGAGTTLDQLVAWKDQNREY